MITIAKTKQGIYVDADKKYDAGVWSETRRSYGWMDAASDDTVMDLGGNIGTAAKLFSERGCRVVSYEPHPDSCRLFRMNAPAAELHEAAVVHDHQKSCMLYLGKMSQVHTIVKRNSKKDSIEVPCIRFGDEIERVKPTHLKIDIEGAEYELLESVIVPDTVRQMCIEFHFTPSKINTRERMLRDIRQLIAQGFALELSYILADRKLLDHKRWTTVVKFARNPAGLDGRWIDTLAAFDEYVTRIDGLVL